MEIVISLDHAVLEALYAIRDPFVVQALIWITELGSKTMVGGLALIVGLILTLRREWAFLGGLSITILGSGVVVFALKEFFERARPDQTFQAYLESGFSLPSGHATISFALYGFLAWMAWRLLPQGVLRTFSVGAASALILTIGFSRLYLGVHYTSDVIAGFAIGGMFVFLGAFAYKRLRRQLSPRSE